MSWFSKARERGKAKYALQKEFGVDPNTVELKDAPALLEKKRAEKKAHDDAVKSYYDNATVGKNATDSSLKVFTGGVYSGMQPEGGSGTPSGFVQPKVAAISAEGSLSDYGGEDEEEKKRRLRLNLNTTNQLGGSMGRTTLG